MKPAEIDTLQIVQLRPKISGTKLGKVVSIRGSEVFVDFDGSPYAPLSARFGISLPLESIVDAKNQQDDVLLTFADQDPAHPIILDILTSKLPSADQPAPDTPVSPDSRNNAIETIIEPQTRTSIELALATIRSVVDGVVYVDLIGDGKNPIPVRSAIALRNLKDPVMVAQVPNGGPVILGQIYPEAILQKEATSNSEVEIRGDKVKIEATSELVLIAGTCKIHLDSRGKLVTLADQVISRARGANKVQGGSVQLN